MKWSKEQITQLTNLCIGGVSNKEIASAMGVDVKEVYAKRSKLGITIDKCKPCERPTEWDPTKTVYERAVNQNTPPKSDIEKAFKALSDELLVAAARGCISDSQCAVYLTYSTLIEGLYKSLKESLRCMED